MSKQAKEFVEFIREQGVVGLAIGLAIGLTASAAVSKIVDGLINPLVGFILGGDKLSDKVWDTGLYHNDVQLSFAYGAVLNSLIILLATATVIFYVVKFLRLEKLNKKDDDKKD